MGEQIDVNDRIGKFKVIAPHAIKMIKRVVNLFTRLVLMLLGSNLRSSKFMAKPLQASLNARNTPKNEVTTAKMLITIKW